MCNLLTFLLVLLAFANYCGAQTLPPPSPAAIPPMKMAGEFKITEPQALAVDHQGRIFVGQADGQLFVFDQGGTKLFALAATDADNRQTLKSPTGIAISESAVYVTDNDLHRVAIFALDGSFLYSFGERGGNDKEFKSPQGIAIHNNVIYVADTNNGRVQVFGANGVFLKSIKGEGKEAPPERRIIEPIAVAIGPQGYLYVIDDDDRRIKIFTNDGAFVSVLPQTKRPAALAMAADGFLVADKKNYCISKYNFDNQLLFSFGSQGKGRAQFISISGLTATENGIVHAADKERGLIQSFALDSGESYPSWRRTPPLTSVSWLQHIEMTAGKISWDGKDTLFAIDTENKSIVAFKDGKKSATITVPDSEPNAIAVDTNGFLWTTDYDNKRVLKLDRQGKILLSFGESGSEPGNFSKPTDIIVSPDGIIYVSDKSNSRVQAFNYDGVFLNAIRTGKNGLPLDSPIALSLASDKTLYVLDKGTNLITAFSPTGQVITAFGGEGDQPENLSDPVDLYANGHEIQVLDAKTKKIKVYDRSGKLVRQFGSAGNGRGDLYKPTAITGLSGNTFAISDTGNQRIQLLQTIPTPAQPRNFTATAGMRMATLAWRKNPEPYGITFRISRSEQENGPFTTLTETKEEPYIDRDVKPNKTYFYLLNALTEGGNQSGTSNMARVTPTTCIPVAPTGLVTQTREWSATITWDPNPEDFITHYFIYRQTEEGLKMVGKTSTPTFTEKSLTSNTSYTYMVAAVSIDDEESPVTSIYATTKVATKPPLEINFVEMKNIFSNTYKLYENQGLGKIKVTNNMDVAVVKLKLTFTIKEFMDFPWETEIEELGADQSREFVIKAVLNNSILNLTEDTVVQSQIKASYYENNLPKNFTRSHTITIYEKHRMMWDVRERFATFVTPKDPLILDFVRSVVSQFGAADGTIHHAAAIFDALSLEGLTYMQDPSNPYQVTSGKTDLIDFIQYPRETLQRKSGDCDDLVALYSAALESIGIRTLTIEVPGHMFMMLATGIEADKLTDTMNNLFIVYEDQLWLPVETTMVGKAFVKAWEQGSEAYFQWKGKNKLSLLDVRTAWGTFKPASLSNTDWRPQAISKSSIEESFPDDFRTLRKLLSRLKYGKIFDQLAANPKDPQAMLQVGIIYARIGELEDALDLFLKILELDPGNAAARNNAGNVFYTLNRFEEAATAYALAAGNDPNDPQILVNLARCYQKLSRPDKAKDAFSKAKELDPNVAQQFRTMAIELLSAL